MQTPNPKEKQNKFPESFDFMAGLSDTAYYNPVDLYMGFGVDEDNFGVFDPSAFLNYDFQWGDESFG